MVLNVRSIRRTSNPQIEIWESSLSTFRQSLEEMPPFKTTLITELHTSKAMVPLGTVDLAI